ncbi:hypothetical protein GDO86_019999 [Hymenochirus boettgeri]|uniref:RING-type domain-containing protein n=1 Tax=Hymenochirus boettgeri TaxID=247094 RepID=A0A8T2IFK4_9PIPI|nr:hypothetical protein GDO86_019999 [Hymenochirus boettgeri]
MSHLKEERKERDRVPDTGPRMSQPWDATYQKLEEEITCAICFNELSDPVSIACGHTYCRDCIVCYWSDPCMVEYCCPECRRICPRDQFIPAYRLGNLVRELRLAKKGNHGKTIQLAYIDDHGQLQVDGSAMQTCLMSSEVSDYPVCLVCVIGEEGLGEFCLLTYILRALSSQDKAPPLSLPYTDDESLNDLEWKAETDKATKGIWMWNKPFILDHRGGKMAVFVVNTDLDINRFPDSFLKLSSLSAILTSYLVTKNLLNLYILNV